jgi:hypothetical protein
MTEGPRSGATLHVSKNETHCGYLYLICTPRLPSMPSQFLFHPMDGSHFFIHPKLWFVVAVDGS